MVAVSVSGNLEYAESRGQIVSGHRSDSDLASCLLHKEKDAPIKSVAPAADVTHPWLNEPILESADAQPLCDDDFYDALARTRWLSQSLIAFSLFALLPPSLIAVFLLVIFWIVSWHAQKRPRQSTEGWQ